MGGPKWMDHLRLEAAGHVDCATLMPVEVSSLPRGLHPRCIAFHPLKPMLAVGVQKCVGGYDLVTGVRMGRADIRAPAVALMFSRDGSLLVVATQEWHIIGINTATWRSRVLAPMNEPRNAPLDSIMMAITGGSRPVVFFTRSGKNSIRMAVNPGAGAAQKSSSSAKLKWGVKLRLDVNKPVAGLAAHPTASQLLVLFDDGSLRSYALASTGLQSIWPAAYSLPGDAAALSRASLTQGPCQVLPHPFIEGAALMTIGTGSSYLLVLELVGKAEPRVVLKILTPGGVPIIGIGVQQHERMLFGFTRHVAGGLGVMAWQMTDAPAAAGPSHTSGLTFQPVKVEVDDLDAPSATAQASSSSTRTNGKAQLAGASNSSSSSSGNFDWQSLWAGGGSSEGMDTPAASSLLLDKLLAPVVESAVLHPTLGCLAVQRAPPLALRQATNIMQQRLGLISAPEAVISRRTAAVPLMRLMHSSMPEVGWPGGSVAALHTGLNFWQTAAGMGPAKLQFPCHLYYLSPGKLSKYALASKKSGCFVDLPPADKSGRQHVAKHLVHSPKQHAWLVFFQSVGGGSSSRSAAVGSSGGDGGWHFSMIHDASAAGQASWFLPGRTGVFLGPQDLYFAIQGANSNTVSVYRTPGFKGKGLPLYTIHLAKPTGLGAGLFPGPGALAAPRIGAEAAAKAAKEAADAADKAAQDAADAAAAAAAAGDGADGAPAAADAADGSTVAATAATAEAASEPVVSSITGRRIRLPGETWRPTDEDDDKNAGDMMVPVIGIGAAYQQAGQGGRGPHRFMAAGYGSHFQDREEGPEEAGEVHSGGGVILWHQAGGNLVMGGLPAPGVQYAAGEDSDDPDAAEPDAAATAKAPDMGQVAGEHSLQLQVNERLVAVQWQNMTQAAPLEPYHCAAALLTTQRLLLVSGDLTVLAFIDASCGSVGLSSAITSFLWVGPALLYMTAGGQVMQLTWTGQVQHMASVGSSPPPLLAGALTDSLLLVRQNPVTGAHEVTSRAVGVLQPLVLGWTSLASCGLLPKGLNTARAALQALLEAFDATHVTSGMLWALIQGWCGDVAAALASHAADVEPSVQLAANAAAGRWPAVVSSLRAEHERSVFYPNPAPQGSQLHHKLLAAAAGAIMHGQFSCAQECLESAGEWETAMALAVCAGDFGALRSMAAGLQSGAAMAAGGEHEAADIARLARGLVAAYERSGRAYNMSQGGKARDWKLRAVMADDSFFSNASDWSFGGPGKMPAMETSSFNAPASFIQEGGVGPVPMADTATLGAYLGNSDLVLEEPAAAAGVQRAASHEQDFLANLDQLVELSSQRTGTAGEGKGGLVRVSSGASSVSSDGAFAAATAATPADGTLGPGAAAAGQGRDPFSFSDDEEDDSTSFGWQQRKFKIHIKSKEEAGGANPAAAGSTGASTPELRSAAQKLKLGPPGAASSAFKEAFAKGGLKRADSGRSSTDEASTSSGLDALYDLSFISKPAAGAAGPNSSAAQQGLPPRAPQPSTTGAGATGGGTSSSSLSSLSALAGLSSSGGLGGPAMRPKPQPVPAPVISDDDFFAALAPVIPETTTSKLLSPPPPPPSAMAAGSSTSAAAGLTGAGGSSSRVAATPLGALAPPPAPAAAKPQVQQAAAAPAAAAGAAGAAPAAAAATGGSAPSDGDPAALYLKGVSEMESANWDAAIDAFDRTLQALQSEAPSPSRDQRQAFAAQYLAAVMLLKAAGAGAGAREAKLYRYTCALKLDDRHSLALVKEAVLRNKHVGNFRYAADQLTWLVTRSLGSAPMDVMAKLQDDIDECDRKGGRNATMTPDEKVDEWVSIVATGTSKQEVVEVVQPLLADS